VSLSDMAVLLTLRTDTEEGGEYPDPYDWFQDSAGVQKSSTFSPEGSMPTTTHTASPAPTAHTTISDEPIPISSDRTITLTPERHRSCQPRLAAPSLESDSEFELPLANQLSTERLVGSPHNVLASRAYLVKQR